MCVNKNSGRLIDLIHLAVLLAIALGIGIYLITTTVLIAKDGVFYIKQAQRFSSDPISIMKAHPPGYPFLIMTAHKFTTLFSNTSSVHRWIYSAQSVSLLCRLLALIPLYFIGKLLVGNRKSFWALLILVILPHSAKLGCEVVREWPYILFFAGGFLFLLWGAKRGKWQVFGLAGLWTGLGYWIRYESTQLVIYGLIWLTLCMFRPKLCGLSKWKALVALVLLFTGFAIPVVPYMKSTGQIIPRKIQHIMRTFSPDTPPDKTNTPKADATNSYHNTAEIAPPNFLKALGEIFKTIGENLMWFFMAALAAGLYYRFRNNAKHEERVLITALVLLNMAMMVLRYCYVQPTVSKRWGLPLITFTIFYIPVGLQVIGNWFECKFPMNKHKTDASKGTGARWFSVLFLIGVCLCLPKLLRPIRIEKQGYRLAAQWLSENTAVKDVIAVPDRRISFYAERKGVLFDKRIPKRARYVVKIVKDESEARNLNGTVKEEYSVWVDRPKKRKKIVIYKVL